MPSHCILSQPNPLLEGPNCQFQTHNKRPRLLCTITKSRGTLLIGCHPGTRSAQESFRVTRGIYQQAVLHKFVQRKSEKDNITQERPLFINGRINLFIYLLSHGGRLDKDVVEVVAATRLSLIKMAVHKLAL